MMDTTEDAFIGGRLVLRQPRLGHRAGLDAVMLAAAVAAGAGESALEAGSGSGVVSLLLARRVAGVRVEGVEIEPVLVELARGNAEANGLEARVAFRRGDVAAAGGVARSGLEPGGFDHVIANPPFLVEGEGRPPRAELRRRAGAMPADALDRWLGFLAAACRPSGRLWLVHRADALPRLLEAVAGRFGAIGIFPLFPRPGAAASRLILTGRKGSRAPLALLPGLVLHGAAGSEFTPEASAVLREGRGLPIG